MTVFHEIDVTQDNPEHAEYLTPAVLRVLALLDLGQRQKAGLGADWGPPVDLIYGEGGSLMTLLFCYDPMVTGDSARSITGATAYALVHDFKAGTWSVGLAVDVMYPTRALSCALQGFAARWPAVQLRLHTDALGAVSALALTGNSLSFTAVIGIIALMGIEIKNSILLVDFTEQLRREGVPLREAIEKAGEVRFLPVLLTSITAIGGLIPLALERSGLYSPLAIAIIGGLVSSTVLSRIATPVLYWLAARGEEKAAA
jgi:hypothetical protein